MNKKILLGGLVATILLSIPYFFLSPTARRGIEKASKQCKQHRYETAARILDGIPAHTSHPSVQLCYGYLEQLQRRYTAANRYFQSAFTQAKKLGNQKLLGEIYLAQAANAYLEHQYASFQTYLDKAAATTPRHPAYLFLVGLGKYVTQDYEGALTSWKDPRLSRKMRPSWLGISLDTLFPSTWRQLHTAHCLLETGAILEAREVLIPIEERRLEQCLSPFLLGLSYIREADTVPPAERRSFYQVARCYLSRTAYQPDREDVCDYAVQEKISSLLEEEAETFPSTLTSSDQQWCFDSIHILQGWDRQQVLERIATKWGDHILTQPDLTFSLLGLAVRTEFASSSFHTYVSHYILQNMSDNLKRGKDRDLLNRWHCVRPLFPDPNAATKTLTSISSIELLDLIRRDTLTLAHTQQFIELWDDADRSDYERELFAQELLNHSKLFWYKELEEKKGEGLMQIALHLSGNGTLMKQAISLFLTTLYYQAESSNMIRRLALIYDALALFDIHCPELVSDQTLANYLADAEYQYLAHNYTTAQIGAAWVLKLDPYNERAQQLIKLSTAEERISPLYHDTLPIMIEGSPSHALSLNQNNSTHPTSCCLAPREFFPAPRSIE